MRFAFGAAAVGALHYWGYCPAPYWGAMPYAHYGGVAYGPYGGAAAWGTPPITKIASSFRI